jgi:hypothetical protein
VVLNPPNPGDVFGSDNERSFFLLGKIRGP